jgi:hypothetical protein
MVDAHLKAAIGFFLWSAVVVLLTGCAGLGDNVQTPDGRYLTVREAAIEGGTLVGTVGGSGVVVSVQESETPIDACAVIVRASGNSRTVVTSSACRD